MIRRHLVLLLFLTGMCCMAGPQVAHADLFVSAASANSVMRFDGTTGALIGNFVAPGAGGLGDPQGIAFGPDGNLYVSNNTSNNVLRFDGETGEFIDEFASVSGMTWPAEITFRDGFLWVSDFSAAGRVSRFDENTGAFVDHFATGISLADGQSWDPNGDLLVSAFGSSSIRRYNGTTGAYMNDFVSPGSGGLSGPLDSLFLANGNFLVSSFNSLSIKQYDADGNYINDPIVGLNGGPQGLEIGPDGHLYVGDFGQGIISRYDANTLQFIDQFATTGGTSTTNNFTFSPMSVPEPGSLGIVAIVSLVLLRRKRRGAERNKRTGR